MTKLSAVLALFLPLCALGQGVQRGPLSAFDVASAPAIDQGVRSSVLRLPTQRTTIIDYSTGSYTTRGNATGPAVTLVNGARKLSWTSAANNQYTGIVADGNWDLSGSNTFAIDFGYERGEVASYFSVWFSSDATYTSFANYQPSANQQNGYNHLPRATVTINKSALLAGAGTVNWSAVKHIEIRFYRSGSSTAPSALYLYRFYANVVARPKVVLTFDDGQDTFCNDAVPIMNAAGIRGTAYIIGSYVGTAGYCTLAQLQALYASGWDIGTHTYDHVKLAGQITSYSRSGTTATLAFASTDPHGKIAGDSVTIAGCDEADYNGTFTIATVPNAYTMTFAVGGTSLNTNALGYCYMVGKVPAATVRSEIQQNFNWLNANGFGRAAQHLAYPYGAWDPDALAIVRDEYGMKTARVVGNSNVNTPFVAMVNAAAELAPTGGPAGGAGYMLPGYDLSPVTGAAALAQVDAAIAAQATMVIMGHGIKASSPSSTQMLTSEFQTFITGLASRRDAGQVDVVTITDWYRKPAR